MLANQCAAVGVPGEEMDNHLGPLHWLLGKLQLANVLEQQVHGVGCAPHPSDVGVPARR